MNRFSVLPQWVIYLFFILGVSSAVAFRALLLVGYAAPAYVKAVWYTGVIGYLAFFLYRYIISRRRKRIIKETDLLKALEDERPLTGEEKRAITYIISSIDRSLENYNYYIIFILSIAAIIIDFYLTW